MNKKKEKLYICEYPKYDITRFIIKYLEPIMQILSITIKDYNINLKTTKCLNTAIMITYILSGKRNIKSVEYCLVDKINKRYKNKDDPLEYKYKVFDSLKKDIKRQTKNHYFYYILITNTYMKNGTKLYKSYNKTAFFPGHVFIVDKHPNCNNPNEMLYNIYQSYINQYDLRGHYERNNNSMILNDVDYLLNGINNIIGNKTWNNEAVNFWNNLTFVDSKNLVGYETMNLNLCYKRVKLIDCYREFYYFAHYHVNDIYNKIKNNEHDYYKIINQENDEFKVKQLNIHELYNEFTNLYEDLGKELKKIII
jgi:hypothetical protein